jgi:hypothetical protein
VLFEQSRKFASVRKKVHAFNEDVKLIRHHAKSMQKKAVFANAFLKEPQNVQDERPTAQTGLTAITANRDEVNPLSKSLPRTWLISIWVMKSPAG